MKPFFAALAFMLVAPASAVTLQDVQQSLAATATMTADFTQTAANGATARGRMTMKRPGKVRFDYGKGAGFLVVADGRTLSFIDYQVGQVSQWPIRSTPLGVLLDPKSDLARVARILPPAQSPVPGATAVLASDPKQPEIGRILVLFEQDTAAPGGLRLAGWRVTDAQNNLTVVTLADPKWNMAVADTAFRFSDPRRRAGPGGKSN
jgi:outer membrane lipoprotein-sorting protein